MRLEQIAVDLDGMKLMIDSGGFFPFEGDIIVIEYGLILYCFNFNPDFTDQHWISLRDSYGILG